MLVIEDANKDVILIGLYELFNKVQKTLSLEELNKMYPVGTKIGIKQPYLKVTASGNHILRNDNVSNIIMRGVVEEESIPNGVQSDGVQSLHMMKK